MMSATRKPTEREKQKFLEYVEKKRLEVKSRQILEGGENSKEYPDDIFVFCYNDIMSKIKEVDFYKNSSEEKQLNFQINILNKLLFNTVKNLLYDVKTIDEEDASNYKLSLALLEDYDLDSFFEKLNFLILTYPDLSRRFVEYIIIQYLTLCKELYIQPSDKVLGTVANIDLKNLK